VVCRLPLVHGSRVWRRNVPTFIITETGSDAVALTRQVCSEVSGLASKQLWLLYLTLNAHVLVQWWRTCQLFLSCVALIVTLNPVGWHWLYLKWLSKAIQRVPFLELDVCQSCNPICMQPNFHATHVVWSPHTSVSVCNTHAEIPTYWSTNVCNAADKVLHQQFRSRLFSQQTMLWQPTPWSSRSLLSRSAWFKLHSCHLSLQL